MYIKKKGVWYIYILVYHKNKMAYLVEYKKQILERMKNEKIADIAKDTGISMPTLYNWRKKENTLLQETPNQEIPNNVGERENKKIIKAPEDMAQDQENKHYNGEKQDYYFMKGYSLFKSKRYRIWRSHRI